MKEKRKKGGWLREIVIEKGPLASVPRGASDEERDRLNAAFAEWAKKCRRREQAQKDIGRIIKDLKPGLLRYLETRGFVRIPSGLAKVTRERYERPSPALAKMARSLLRRQPRNECAKETLRIAKEGRTVRDYLSIRDAYDQEPAAYAAWQSLQLIAILESALAKKDLTRACGIAYRLGMMVEEGEVFGLLARQKGDIRKGCGNLSDRAYERAIAAAAKQGLTRPKDIYGMLSPGEMNAAAYGTHLNRIRGVRARTNH